MTAPPTEWLALFQAAMAPAMLVLLVYNADKLLSTQASKDLAAQITNTAAEPALSKGTLALEEFLREKFPSGKDRKKFWLNVLALTAISLTVLLAVYTSRTSGLLQQLFTKGFILQFLGVGVVTTLLVNAFAFSQYPNLLASFASQSVARNVLWLLADLAAKAILFLALTAIMYMVFAKTRGAFGGDLASALQAVPRTVHLAIRFENLTAVYVYSLVLSSFPLQLAILVKLMIVHPRLAVAAQKLLYFLPLAEKPFRGAAVVLALFASLFCLILALLIGPFAS